MVKKAGDFPLEMFLKIEEVALKEKKATAEVIRETVLYAIKNFENLKLQHKQLLLKKENKKGFTYKRKVIHFTIEQALFLEKTAMENNLYITEVIRACVNAYFGSKIN